MAAESKARLENIYLPYKPKRRTKAMIARENGLEPLADTLLADPTQDPNALAEGYLNEQVADAVAALEGARAILVERFPHEGVHTNRCEYFGFADFRAMQRSDLQPSVHAGDDRRDLVGFTRCQIGESHAEVRNSLDEFLFAPGSQKFFHCLDERGLPPGEFPTGAQQADLRRGERRAFSGRRHFHIFNEPRDIMNQRAFGAVTWN